MAPPSSRKQSNFLWKLPAVQTPELGRIGPGFGYGMGCGVGLGVGLVGGAGLGFGFPGLNFGAGVGAGCGLGIGFGYGVGKGRAYDENGKHNNLAIPKKGVETPMSELGVVVDKLFVGMVQAIERVDREIINRRRK
ncbi:hypothetical protein KP509_26G004800 [Ceratopteris richardii]|uniref:Uncharacterized protein n=1 Tax=Ceratopteris richardii TaxID=49495 RepID=A0A8T2RJM7_CERRI|nr:hypothetical protein KP509_26G004800 [Ceratopteris richardii]